MSNTQNVFVFRFRTIFLFVITSAISALGFLWPFLVTTRSSNIEKLFLWSAVPIALAVLIVEISNRRLDAKSVALLGVLAGIASVLRPLGAGVAGIEPMWFLLILSARVFGSGFGFVLGVLSLFVSAFITGGFGPWLAYQMFAAGWIGFLAGSIPQRFFRFKIRGRVEIALLTLYAIFAAMFFGLLMDLQFWPWAVGSQTQLSYIPGGSISDNVHRYLVFHFTSSMAWDVPRAIFTSALTIIAGPAILFTLRRAHRKAAFVAPIEFGDLARRTIERVKAQTGQI